MAKSNGPSPTRYSGCPVLSWRHHCHRQNSRRTSESRWQGTGTTRGIWTKGQQREMQISAELGWVLGPCHHCRRTTPVTKESASYGRLSSPQNVGQLRSFLGMVQDYARFLPDLTTHLAPLHRLVQKDEHWIWDKEQECAFRTVREMLFQDRVFTHFNPDLPVVVACDSSSYGLDAVLSHRMPDGSERPIAYASRSLTQTEKKFAQIEKDALGLYWGVRKFPPYLEGRRFILITDHKPLKYIMDPGKTVPVTTAARLQRCSTGAERVVVLSFFTVEFGCQGSPFSETTWCHPVELFL